MRNRSTTVSPIGDIPRGIQISIVSKPTRPTSEQFPVPLSSLYRATLRARDGSVGPRDQVDSNPRHLAQQQHTFGKEPACPLLPARQSFRVLQGYASTSALRHGHNTSGFFGKHLFLKRSIRPLVDALLLLHGPAVTLFSQYGAQVGAFVAIRSHDRPTHADITTKKALGLGGLTRRLPASCHLLLHS